MEPIHLHRGVVALKVLFNKTFRPKRHTPLSGFTLVELLVVFVIIVSIMSVVYTNQGSFNKSFVVSNTAYDIALSLRNAETYGLGSRALGSTVNAGYGLHFEKTSPTGFSLFADVSPAATCSKPDCKPGDNVYTVGSDSLVRTYALGNSVTISDFCAMRSGTWTCAVAHGGYLGGLSSLDVVFARPNPNPLISTNGAYSTSITSACLKLSSALGTSRYVSVSFTGEITPTATSCP